MNRKVYSKPSIAVVPMTSTPLLAAGSEQYKPIPFGGKLDGKDKIEDEPEPTTDIIGTKWYTAE